MTPESIIARLRASECAESATHSTRAGKSLTRAAVLIPLIQRDQDVDILLTVRSQSLRQHGGQISFPGGRADQTDHGLQHTALRETHEEIGIDREHIELLAELPESPTVSGYRVKPYIGLILGDPRIDPNPSEVDEVFHYPISHLLADDAICERQVFYRGKPREYQLIMYQNFRIWGATAAILLQFKQLLGHNAPGEPTVR